MGGRVVTRWGHQEEEEILGGEREGPVGHGWRMAVANMPEAGGRVGGVFRTRCIFEGRSGWQLLVWPGKGEMVMVESRWGQGRPWVR